MDDNFKMTYNDYKKGNINNIYKIIDLSLYIVLNELLNVKKISEEIIIKGINCLINSIETYSYEKFSDFFTYSKTYVSIYFKKQIIVEPLVKISKEKMEEYIEKLKFYYNFINESNINNKKNEKNTLKMLLLSKKNGIL